MIKKILYSIILTLLSVVIAFADETHQVNIDNGSHKSAMIELSYCNIFITLTDIDDNDNVSLNVEIENTSDYNNLLFFDKSYDEKTLKKGNPSIRYDKIFGGSKGLRIIDSSENVKRTFFVRASDKNLVATLDGVSGDKMTCRLPIYIAKYKGKKTNRLLLLGKDVIELDINVTMLPDDEFTALSNEVDALKENISKQTFCTNKKHKGTSFRKLKEKYMDDIDELKTKINKERNSRGYMSTDRGYKKFQEIILKLDSINIDSLVVTSCPKDGRSGSTPTQSPLHKCSYCSQSYISLHNTLQNMIIKIHNGKASKNSVAGQVNAIKTCMDKNKSRTDDGARARCYQDIKDINVK